MFGKEGKKIQKHLQNIFDEEKVDLVVTESKNMLGFTIKKPNNTARFPSLTTGWQGFVTYVEQNQNLGVPKEQIFNTITVNGILLNKQQELKFWRQYEAKL